MAIEILQTEKDTLKMRCGYCPRVIFKLDEIDGEFKQMDGKAICMVCRATKTSKFKKEINARKKEYKKIKEKEDDESKEKAKESAIEVAVFSQERLGKKYRLKK